ncbi:MAG: hypothetical protein GY866_18900, partial [Proteobacteria bacterium]|nr:hypothetical protein [Pseudomonadota bacterium]
IQKTGKNLVLGPNSLIEVTNSGLVAQNGTLEGSESSSRLVSGLMKRFTKSQSYTTVRRSAKSNGISIDAVRKITLSDAHPDLVWNNCGAKYRYQLTVGEDVYDVPATQDRVIRVSIRPFAGTRPFKISVFEGDTTITAMEQYKSRGKLKDRTIVWLSGDKSTKIETTVAEIQQTYGEDSFMLGSFFEKENIWVAAMDQYKLYLRENPDEIEMTPYLFRVYKKLKLSAVYKSELAAWTDAMNE